MSTSGSYSFNPDLGSLTLYAYNLIGVRNTSILQEHIESARMATNLLLSRWSADGLNLWQVELVTVPLVSGTSTYSVPSNTVVVLDMYIEYGSPPIDRIILPISRTEYASYPNKQQSGFPTVAWFDRLLSPTITIWPVPDGTQTSLKYYRLIQLQDANMNGTQQLDIPYYFLDALAYALAVRLAQIWSPDKVALLKPFADEAYQIAIKQNVETASYFISPQLSGYWR
jgi:hypothetical protein